MTRNEIAINSSVIKGSIQKKVKVISCLSHVQLYRFISYIWVILYLQFYLQLIFSQVLIYLWSAGCKLWVVYFCLNTDFNMIISWYSTFIHDMHVFYLCYYFIQNSVCSCGLCFIISHLVFVYGICPLKKFKCRKIVVIMTFPGLIFVFNVCIYIGIIV